METRMVDVLDVEVPPLSTAWIRDWTVEDVEPRLRSRRAQKGLTCLSAAADEPAHSRLDIRIDATMEERVVRWSLPGAIAKDEAAHSRSAETALPASMGGRCWISPSCAAGMRLRWPGTTGWCPGQRSAPARTTASRCLRSRRRLRSLRSRRPGTSFARRRWRWPRRRATPTALLLSSRRTRPCCTRYALAVLSKLELLG